MKTLIKLYFFLTVIYSVAQTEDLAEIEVHYKVESSQNANIPESPEASRIIKQMNSFMDYIEFELIANKEKAIFKMKKLLTNDNTPNYISNLAIVSCDGNEIWYSDSGNQTKFVVTSGLKEPTRLNYNQVNQWQITKETKTIGDFTCYKAITLRNEGSRNIQFVAWFAPDLPFGYGPIGLDGLPGTILQLRLEDLVYSAIKVKRNPRKKITAPKYQNEMTYQEYYKKLDEEVGAIKQSGY